MKAGGCDLHLVVMFQGQKGTLDLFGLAVQKYASGLSFPSCTTNVTAPIFHKILKHSDKKQHASIITVIVCLLKKLTVLIMLESLYNWITTADLDCPMRHGQELEGQGWPIMQQLLLYLRTEKNQYITDAESEHLKTEFL